MKISACIVLGYALIILLGGMMGYQKAHSYSSLIVGTISAILLFGCSIGMFRKSTLAYSLALALILALMLFFGYRFALTGKFMPSGMMILISGLSLFFVFQRRKKKAKFT